MMQGCKSGMPLLESAHPHRHISVSHRFCICHLSGESCAPQVLLEFKIQGRLNCTYLIRFPEAGKQTGPSYLPATPLLGLISTITPGRQGRSPSRGAPKVQRPRVEETLTVGIEG